LEELREFRHLLLNLLDIFMSSSNVLCDPLGITASIALDELRRREYDIEHMGSKTYRLTEDLLIRRVFYGFLDLSVTRVWSHDSVLSCNLLLSSAPEIAL
jgi:hypothetical protein